MTDSQATTEEPNGSTEDAESTRMCANNIVVLKVDPSKDIDYRTISEKHAEYTAALEKS